MSWRRLCLLGVSLKDAVSVLKGSKSLRIVELIVCGDAAVSLLQQQHQWLHQQQRL